MFHESKTAQQDRDPTVDRGPPTEINWGAQQNSMRAAAKFGIDDNQANALRLYNVVQSKYTLIRFGG